MRRSAAHLACLALIGTGCLNRVASLTGLADGGDAGSSCDWRDAGDAGICTDDSQCPDNYYCDFTATECPADAGTPMAAHLAVINAGSCLPACPVRSCNIVSGPCGACNVGEDCAPSQECYWDLNLDDPPLGGAICTIQSPCSGYCADTTAFVPLPDCAPSACHPVRVPHWPLAVCVCDGNTCDVPDGLDGGMLAEDGGGIDSGSSVAMNCAPSFLDFGAVTVNTSKTLLVTCTNVGTAPMAAESELSYPYFNISHSPEPPCGWITQGQSCEYNVTYAPLGVETVSDKMAGAIQFQLVSGVPSSFQYPIYASATAVN